MFNHKSMLNTGKTYVGKNFLANYNFVLQDSAPIHIVDNVLIASNVTITTILHSRNADERAVQCVSQKFPKKNKGLYVRAKPITIGNNVWVCANTTICPGVTIGDNYVIGAGSIVTRDILPNVFACGAPCKPVKTLTDEEKL